MPPEEREAIADLRDEAGGSAKTSGLERAPDGGDQEGACEEGGRIDHEGRNRREGEQGRADRKTDDLAGRQLGTDHAGVGLFEASVADELGDRSRGRGVDQYFTQPDHEGDEIDERQAVALQGDRRRQQASGDRTGSIVIPLTAETAIGSRVIDAVSSGSAPNRMPSPRFDNATAARYRQKSSGRRGRGSPGVTPRAWHASVARFDRPAQPAIVRPPDTLIV